VDGEGLPHRRGNVHGSPDYWPACLDRSNEGSV